MKGKSALTYVLDTHNACSFEEQKRITKKFPDPAKISGELKDMEEEDEDGASLIKWTIINNPKDYDEWVSIDKDGNIECDFGQIFDQSIRIEVTKHHHVKHAAGIIISSDPLHQYFPMEWDPKLEANICGQEYVDLEKCGACKVDILGLAALDKIQMVLEMQYES